MDHERICDCAFASRCESFKDRLIDESRKGPDGLGCRAQSDVYRAKHCKTFRCVYLCAVISDGLKHLVPSPRRAQET